MPSWRGPTSFTSRRSSARHPALLPRVDAVAAAVAMLSDVGDHLGPALHADLSQNPRDVVAHGAGCQMELGGDLRIAQTRADQVEHLALLVGERTERVALQITPPVQQLTEHVGRGDDLIA